MSPGLSTLLTQTLGTCPCLLKRGTPCFEVFDALLARFSPTNCVDLPKYKGGSFFFEVPFLYWGSLSAASSIDNVRRL